MTVNQLKEAALNRFAEHGYEGTSMAHIAEAVGIKKQSIYAHFKGKDELFLQVSNDVVENELASITEFIEQNQTKPIKEFLYDFLVHHKIRYEQNADTKFWLRNSFFPPAHLYEEVMEKVYLYLDTLEDQLEPILENAVKERQLDASIDVKRATAAFLGVLDGIFVEMLYGGPERLNKRLDASWHFYWRGISKV
ncbi:TetR family transcriptional regulator [Planococcus glaciei]|uniref:TetR/AcrR family transcriptional regulator n=1 Tax=Planococcus glaciei TaxID=459472 RepID=UPI00069FCAB8|nr:TetR/AcrR family transcriptional regulator [Planococcus glaciei]KOF11773.1 TetR family transcriptional regulator [Planococcus glaciei]